MFRTPSNVRRPLATILVWATASFVAALCVALPPRLNATDSPNDAPRALIAQPTFTGDGYELTARWIDGQLPDPGDALRLEVEVINRTDRSIQIAPVVQFTSQPPSSKMSRTLSFPAEIGRETLAITLAPNERKTVRVETNVHRPGTGSLVVNVGDGTHFIVGASGRFSHAAKS